MPTLEPGPRNPYNTPMITRLTPMLLTALITLFAAPGCAQTDPPESDEEARATIRAMYEGYRKQFPDIAETTPAEIAKDYKKDQDRFVIVDVRTPKEQEVSMIPGALTQKEFEAKRDGLEDKRVIVHCTIGFRSGMYVKKLKEEGYDAENLAGSLLLWTHEGLPLVDKEGEPTKKVHVYGSQWNLVREDYEGVW